MLCDIAFMGGGVRGIAFAGAVKGLEDAGYKPRRVAGTSAGAIAAALVAAGFSGEEMRKELSELDYRKFKTKDHLSLPISELINLRRDYGIYSADNFEAWLEKLLKRKGKATFGDLERGAEGWKLQLTASDMHNKRLLVLPQDLKLFGLNPKTFSIAKAVRMSMSIPLFYEACRLKDSSGKEHLIVDGGLFCNYPIWLLDDGCGPTEVPVFGMRFAECESEKRKERKLFRLTDYIKLVIGAVLDADGHGYARVTTGDTERNIDISVCVDGKTIGAVDFGLDKKTAAALFGNGYKASTDFLKGWDFEKWLKLRVEE